MKKRKQLKRFLKIKKHDQPVDFELLEKENFDNFERQLITYKGSEGDDIKAYLFIPSNQKIIGSVLVHHQHDGERHLGKSEVSGLIGDKYQFFCEALCEQGLVTLAPDSISFEDRRTGMEGLEPDENDVLQHYNELCYRLLRNETLMKKVIEDSMIAISLLYYNARHDHSKIGILGHSYGGNTVIFHSALDKRIQYSCSSGAVCSYANKIENGTGIELAEVIPGFVSQYDIIDLLECICPRKLLIVSATEDKFSMDAAAHYEILKKKYEKKGHADKLDLHEYEGGHPLDKVRFDRIIDWMVESFKEGVA